MRVYTCNEMGLSRMSSKGDHIGFGVEVSSVGDLEPVRAALDALGGGLSLFITNGPLPGIARAWRDPYVCKWWLDLSERDRDGSQNTIQTARGIQRFHTTEEGAIKLFGADRRFLVVVSFVDTIDARKWLPMIPREGGLVFVPAGVGFPGEAPDA